MGVFWSVHLPSIATSIAVAIGRSSIAVSIATSGVAIAIASIANGGLSLSRPLPQVTSRVASVGNRGSIAVASIAKTGIAKTSIAQAKTIAQGSISLRLGLSRPLPDASVATIGNGGSVAIAGVAQTVATIAQFTMAPDAGGVRLSSGGSQENRQADLK